MATVFALRWRKVNWPPSGRGPGGGWTVGDDCETWRDASFVAGADGLPEETSPPGLAMAIPSA